MALRIRKATPEDASDMHRIDSAFEWKDYIHPVAAHEGRVLLAVAGEGLTEEDPVGYLRYGSFLWDDRAPFIQAVMVRKDALRQGIATALIQHLIADTEVLSETHGYAGVYSSVDETNVASMNLHEKLGFTSIGQLAIPDQTYPEVVYFRPVEFTP